MNQLLFSACSKARLNTSSAASGGRRSQASLAATLSSTVARLTGPVLVRVGAKRSHLATTSGRYSRRRTAKFSGPRSATFVMPKQDFGKVSCGFP